MLSALSVTEYVILNEKLCVTNCCRTCVFFRTKYVFPKGLNYVLDIVLVWLYIIFD